MGAGFQGPARQVRSLARGKAVQAIFRGLAREPISTIAPTEQSTRVNRQAVAGGQQAKHQVVILWPAHGAVAEFTQHPGADHQGGVGDGAFHEGVSLYRGGVGQAIEPLLVVAPSRTEARAGKDANPRPHGGEFGGGLQPVELCPESVAMHPIVGVHAGHHRRPAVFKPLGQAFHQAAARRAHGNKARIFGGDLGQERGSRVARAVVDGDALPAGFALALDTPQAGRQGGGGIAVGKQDGDARSAVCAGCLALPGQRAKIGLDHAAPSPSVTTRT